MTGSEGRPQPPSVVRALTAAAAISLLDDRFDQRSDGERTGAGRSYDGGPSGGRASDGRAESRPPGRWRWSQSRVVPDWLGDCLGAAEQRWGLAGVTAELAGQSGLMLITTAAALPRGHPLAQRGLDDDVAGLLLADPWSGLAHVTMGRWLTAALAGRLVGRCRALEAQAALAAFTAQPSSPAAAWLDWVGFRPHSRFPPGLVPFWRLTHRYRLDLDATLPSVLADQPRRPTVRWWLGPKAAPATRA